MNSKLYKNKTLLITGGTGSFGSTVLDKLKNSEFNEIRILSRDEKKQHDLRLQINDPRVKFLIGDVRNVDSVERAVSGVDFIFHAAALKQVPSCEFFPIEATKTNVIGTHNVVSQGIAKGVKNIICLSTDKAAYPINAMGISKALMEKVAIAASRETKNTKVCITRYGNVMASRGSVIPLFIEQILNNKAITITEPKMTRFLMSLDEAVDLVEFAFMNGENGDLFIQKAPSCTIETLASALIRIFNGKNEIKFIGKRHGEKMYETLGTKEEMTKAEDLKNFFRIKSDQRDLNYEQYFTVGDTGAVIDEYNSDNTTLLNEEEVIKKLLELEYVQHRLK